MSQKPRRGDNIKNLKLNILVMIVVTIIIGLSFLCENTIENKLGLAEPSYATKTYTTVINSNTVVHYIDVGQGDATFIELSDSTNVLIDTGSNANETDLLKYLKNLGVTYIDYLIITHSDEDHAGGADAILKEFEVQRIFRPYIISENPGVLSGTTIGYDPLKLLVHDMSDVKIVNSVSYANFIKYAYAETFNGEDTLVTVSYDGVRIMGDDYCFEFFAPLKADESPLGGNEAYGYATKYYASENNYSPIIRFESYGRIFVFTGDAEIKCEKEFIDSLTETEYSGFVSIDVLKLGHHGSKTSSCIEFINLLKPKTVVITCGKNNKYGHPDKGVPDIVAAMWKEALIDGTVIRTDINSNAIIGISEELSRPDGIMILFITKGISYTTPLRWWEIALALWVLSFIVVFGIRINKEKTKKYNGGKYGKDCKI